MSEFIVDDFWEATSDFLVWVRSTRATIEQVRAKLCQDLALSQYIITYLRMLVSFHLQANEEQFAPYVADGSSIADFCKNEVEPVDREADQLQTVALVAELGVPARIVQLTQADDGPLSSVDLGGDAGARVCLLFRPGHYDLLYARQT